MDAVTNARDSLRRAQTVPLAGVFTRVRARNWGLDLTRSLRIYLGALVLAELAVSTQPAWGLALHLGLLCALLVHSSFGPHRGRALVLALALAPLVRVVSLGLPLTDLPPLSRDALAAVPLAAAGGAAARVLGLGRAELGLRAGQFQQQLRIGLLGLPVAAVEYLIARPTPIPVDFSAPVVVLSAPLLLIWLGLVEEFLFRGVLQAAVRMDLGWRGLVYVSAVYGLLHIGSGSVDAVFISFCIGLGFAGVVVRTGSLLGISLAHGLANIVLQVVLPLLALLIGGSPLTRTAPTAELPSGPGEMVSEPRVLVLEPGGSGWQTWYQDPEGSAWPGSDGSYHLLVQQPEHFVAVGAPLPSAVTDVVVRATFRKIGGPPGGGYGLIVRDQQPGPRDSGSQTGWFYLLEVSDAGAVGIWRREGSRWRDLQPWTPTPAVQPGDAANQLEVEASGPRLTLRVNGLSVASWEQTLALAGGVGVFVGGGAGTAVRLEDFLIQVPG